MPAKTSVSPGARYSRPVLAGGAVVSREDPIRGTEVVLIHRKRYNDWTLPKGKLEAGESIPVCAVREVLEETGVTIRLGVAAGPDHLRGRQSGSQAGELVGRRDAVLGAAPTGRRGRRGLLAADPDGDGQADLLPRSFPGAAVPRSAADDAVDHRPAREGDGPQGLVAQGCDPADQRPRAAAGEAADPDAVRVRSSAVDQLDLDPVHEHGPAVRRGREDPRSSRTAS